MQSPTDQYLAQRRASGWKQGSFVSSSRGFRVPPDVPFELDGRLTGILAGDEDDAVLILTLPDNSTVRLTISVQPVWLHSGSTVRVLATVSKSDADGVLSGIPPMTVIAVASAADIALREARWFEERLRAEARWLEAERRVAPTVAVKKTQPSSASVVPTPKPGTVGSIARLRAALSQKSQSVFASYKGYIKRHNRRLSDAQADQITYGILRFSEEYDLDPRLAVATVVAESDFRITETSHKGAMGLIQLMPDEVKRLRLSNPYDPVQNLAGGIYLIKERLNKYSKSNNFDKASDNHLALALASYNAGMGAVRRWGGIPPYRETQGYVRKIMKLYRELCSGDGR